MSHELRTPLNAILGYTEAHCRRHLRCAAREDASVLKRVESNGRHLLGLINSVPVEDRGRSAHARPRRIFARQIATVHGAVEALAVDKKLAFKAEAAADLPRGRGNERGLTQVLLNLVGNAIKFTDAGEVAIRAAVNNGSFDVSVCDTGPGISRSRPSQAVQRVSTGRQSQHPQEGRHGAGTCHFRAHPRDARRTDLDRVRRSVRARRSSSHSPSTCRSKQTPDVGSWHFSTVLGMSHIGATADIPG